MTTFAWTWNLAAFMPGDRIRLQVLVGKLEYYA
jgi:hypothetical protein